MEKTLHERRLLDGIFAPIEEKRIGGSKEMRSISDSSRKEYRLISEVAKYETIIRIAATMSDSNCKAYLIQSIQEIDEAREVMLASRKRLVNRRVSHNH